MLADRTYRHCCPGVGHSSNNQVTAVQSGNDMHHCAGIRCGRGPRRLVEPYCQCQRLRRLDQGRDRRESQTATTMCGSISRPRPSHPGVAFRPRNASAPAVAKVSDPGQFAAPAVSDPTIGVGASALHAPPASAVGQSAALFCTLALDSRASLIALSEP